LIDDSSWPNADAACRYRRIQCTSAHKRRVVGCVVFVWSVGLSRITRDDNTKATDESMGNRACMIEAMRSNQIKVESNNIEIDP
jgi:hypothetical protein